MILSLLIASCDHPKDSANMNKSSAPRREINDVLNDHAPELMKISGVTGVAIGELDDHSPCITLLVTKARLDSSSALPTSLEGYPVRFELSEEIRPMSH